jgi:hypothetical protein
MKKLVLATVAMIYVAFQSLFLPVTGATVATVVVTEMAWADNCPNRSLATCEGRDPTHHDYVGNQNIALEYSVIVCHPDFGQLARKWFSFAFFPERRQSQAVSGLMSGQQWREKVEVPEGQRCAEHFYQPGRVLMIVSPCRVPGKNVILVTRPLTADDNGTEVRFYEIADSAF